MLRRVMLMFRGHYAAGGCLALLMLLSAAITLLTPFLYKELVDGGIYRQDAATIGWMTASIAGTMLLQELLSLGQTSLTLRMRESIFTDLKQSIYTHLMNLPPSFYTEQHTGKLMSRLTSDVQVLQHLFLDRLVGFLKNIVVGMLIVAAILYIEWRMAITAAACLPLLYLFYRTFRRSISSRSRAYQEKRERLQSRWQEDLSMVRAFQTFSAVEQRIQGTLPYLHGEAKARTKLDMQYAAASSSTVIINLIGLAVIWGMGSILVMEGVMTIGTLIAISFFLTYIIHLFYSAYYTVIEIEGAIPSAGRIFDLLDTQNPLAENVGREVRDLRGEEILFESVSFAYSPGKWVLRQADLRFKPGDIAGIVGNSGQGKTTLANLMQRMADPQEGSITFGGVDIRSIPLDSLRRAVAVIPQEDQLLDQSIRDNIRLGRDHVSDERFEAACAQAQVSSFIPQMADGYDTIVGERGMKLSGGQRKRIMIARALLEDPYVLILDEATSMLDEAAERSILESLRSIASKRIVLLITHKSSNLVYTNRVIRLHEGRVV